MQSEFICTKKIANDSKSKTNALEKELNQLKQEKIKIEKNNKEALKKMLSKQIIEESQKFAKEAVETLKTSVSPYNFVETAKKLLNQNSFTQIFEGESWKLTPGSKYFYTRNNSAIIAFSIGKKYDPLKSCFKII